MTGWKQSFAKRVDTLRETAVGKFETFAEATLAEAYQDFSEFTSQHDFRCTAPQHDRGTRFYKFALSEDAYVLMYFRTRGMGGLECEYECSVPGLGCTESERMSVPASEANRTWIERCFQTALDDLVDRVTRGCTQERTPEAVATVTDD